MSLHSHTCFLCSRRFPEIIPEFVASSSSADLPRAAAGGLRRVGLKRRFSRLCAIAPLGSRWDRRSLVVTNATQEEGSRAGGEINFDDADLMTLEFGRLLGEPNDKTLSKVVRRKLEPDMTYLGIEKVARKGNWSKLSSNNLVNYQVHLEKPKRSAMNKAAQQHSGSASSKLPYLASRPVRQYFAAGKFSQAGQPDPKAAASSIKRVQMETHEIVDETLLRKPSLNKRSTDGMATVLPTAKDVLPEVMNMKMQKVESLQKEQDVLRKPFLRNANKARYKNASELNEKLKDLDLPSHASADEPLVQNQAFDQRQTKSIAATLPAENARQSGSEKMKLQTMESFAEESMADDNLVRRPSMKNVSKSSSTSTNGHDRILMSNEMALSVRAANSCPEDFQIGQNEKKTSLPMPKLDMLPELQDNDTIKRSEFEHDDILDKPSLQTSEKIVSAETPEQMHAHNDYAQMLNLQVPEHETLFLTFRQPVDEEPFITVSKEKLQLGEEVPLVEASASLDAGSYSKLHMKLSRPNQLANGSQSHDMSTTALQSKVQKFRVETDATPRTPGETQSMCKEKVITSGNAKLKSDIQSESDLNSVAGPGVKNMFAGQADSTDERVVRDLDSLNASEENTLASLMMQDLHSGMSSEEHGRKQQLRDPSQDKTFLDGVSIDSGEDSSSAEHALENAVGQAAKTLRRPMRCPTEEEESDWARAEALLKSGEQVEVTVIGGNSVTLTVAFGRLLGFIPLFELSPKRGLVEFPAWAQRKGFDVTGRKDLKNGGVADIDCLDSVAKAKRTDKFVSVTEGEIKELRKKYNEEIISAFVGKKASVIVKSVDKSGRRLKFSERAADPDSGKLAQKKADLMDKLKVGDIVTCEVRNITPIGVFVELDGVFALIHHSEVSWNAGVDASSVLRIGEVINARVCRLDRILQRINLSLKQMQADPLMKTLESVVGDMEGGTSQLPVIESEVVEWPELEALIRKLEGMEAITCVSKGRCLCSVALAPSFQVFLSSPQDGGYKLLTRLGNKIQEVLVDTTLDREKMKEFIRMCTFTES